MSQKASGRRAFLGVVLAGVALLASSCKPNANAAADAGLQSDAAPVVAKRIVSISPSTTETLVAIGARSALVGRSRYCDYPPEVLSLPQVGGYVDPSVEAILALSPDLVVGARGPQGRALVDVLSARGIATYFPETESIDAIAQMIVGLGERTGKRAEAAETLRAMREKIAAVESAERRKPRVRVLLVFGLRPVVVAGPEGFPNEMLARVNAENVVVKGGAYPSLSFETVIAQDPDVIVNAAIAESHGGQPITRDAAGWANVRAVKEGHVVSLADEAVLRPGPRIGDGIASLAKAIRGTP
jgi:iron complex transport system substrate-binding protein